MPSVARSVKRSASIVAGEGDVVALGDDGGQAFTVSFKRCLQQLLLGASLLLQRQRPPHKRLHGHPISAVNNLAGQKFRPAARTIVLRRAGRACIQRERGGVHPPTPSLSSAPLPFAPSSAPSLPSTPLPVPSHALLSPHSADIFGSVAPAACKMPKTTRAAHGESIFKHAGHRST
eukprot:m.751432 g.751432  ORF g.751432 m.751432 type:complete len:176 (+) comp58983_c1_seq4:3389-3916(+)